jgi:hypothetical protein
LTPRGDHKVPVYDEGAPATYFTAGQSAQRFGKGLFEVHRKLKHQKQMIEPSELLHNYMARATHVATSYMNPRDRLFAKFVKVMAKLKDFCIANNIPVKTIWTSIAIAMNVAMEKHIDDDFFMGLVGVLGRNGYHDDDSNPDSILQYFCFPVLGSAVALRNGDMLMFNPRIAHCISSRATKVEDVICTSLYLKTAVVGGNDNNRTVGDVPTVEI